MPDHAAVTNIVFAGLGGLGVLRASDILAEAAFLAGFDVKKSEIHGMSQRGGSVRSDVRFGAEVLSPMITAGEADCLVVLHPSQVEVVRKTTQRARLWRLERPQAGKGFWGGFAALILASSLYALKRRKSREERIVRRYFKEVQRHYGAQALTPAMGLDELAGRLDDPACRQFAHLYGRAVYRDRALSANEFRRLRRIIREIGKNAR